MLEAMLQSVPLPAHAVCGRSAAVLDAIRQPPITLALWRRQLAPSLERWICGIDLDAVEDLSFTAEVDQLDRDLADALDSAGYGRSPGGELLRRDMEALARHFFGIVGQPRIELRLEVIETNSCRKFHADYVSARLITTYVGRGTEWLGQADAEAHSAGAPVEAVTVRRVAAGEVAILKGRLWEPDHALVHRSPPIEGTGQSRLVLVLNPCLEAGVTELDERAKVASASLRT